MALQFTGRSRKSQEAEESSVPLAPLIDIIFILLIFFLMTATFTRDHAVDVTKPTSASGHPLSGESLVVTVKPDGSLLFNGDPVPLDALQNRVKNRLETENQKTVVIASDRRVRTGLLVQVMDLCKLAGADTVSIATRKQ